MRFLLTRYLQVIVFLVVVLTFLALFSSDDDIVIPQGGKVMKNIKSFMGSDVGDKKWDPFGLGLPSDKEMAENIVFRPNLDTQAFVPIRTCKKVLDFAFVKTHKAGSTTLISILQRFGHTHNLSFALPIRGDVFLGWPYKLQPHKHVLPLEDKTMNFNVLVNHAIFNKTVIQEILPNNPKFIGVVRYPLTHFKSVMNYFQKMLIPADEVGKYSMMERIIRFADDPNYYDGYNDKMKNSPDPYFHVRSVTHNFQAADFGLGRKEMDNPEEVEEFMADLKETFPFLLVMEYMQESLLLLKRKWCWDITDILFLQKNVFKYQNKNDPIPVKTAEKLLDWMSVDLQIYKWANATLWKEISKEKGFGEELTYYKSVNSLIGSYCKADIMLFRSVEAYKNPRITIPKLEIAGSPWNAPFSIELEDCKNLMRFEMAYTRLLQINQRPDLFDDSYYFKGNDGIRKPIKPAAKSSPQKVKSNLGRSAAEARVKYASAKRFKYIPPTPAPRRNSEEE